MQEVEISRMVADDLDGVYEVEKTAFPMPWPISSFQDELKNMFAKYLVAKIDGKVVGYIGMWLVMDECHITNVAVHEDYRRNKIATKLILAMFELCKEYEIQYFDLEVRINNFAAQKLYKKFGFKEDSVRKGYYKNPDNTREDAILMSFEI